MKELTQEEMLEVKGGWRDIGTYAGAKCVETLGRIAKKAAHDLTERRDRNPRNRDKVRREREERNRERRDRDHGRERL